MGRIAFLRSRRRQALLGVVVAVAGITGGVFATFDRASSNVHPPRQLIVNRAVAQIGHAFGDHLVTAATIVGSHLIVDVPGHGPRQSTVGPLEGLMVAHAAEEGLQAAGAKGIVRITVGNWGTVALSPLRTSAQLSAGACNLPAGVHLANTSAASGRVIPALGGFCAFRLTTADPVAFADGVETTLSELRSAAPLSESAPDSRALVVETYDKNGKPVIIAAWGGGTNEGGSVYVRSGLCTPLADPQVIGGSCY